MKKTQSPWLIVDGRNLLWRATRANEHLSTKIGGKRVRTGGVYGFLMTLLSVHQRYGGRVIIAWEGTHNFRFGLFPEYKPRVDDDERRRWVEMLNDQERRLKRVLASAGVPQYSGVGCEADDVMATIATKLKGPVLIYSMDSDLRQLVNASIKVISSGFKGDTIYDSAQVVKRHGVPPDKIPDLKALSGDHSDGIPGVQGIGDKTAVKLLGLYKSLGNVIRAARREAAEWPVGKRFVKAVADEHKILRMYLKLTTVKRDVELIEIPTKRNRAALQVKLIKYRFRSLSYENRIEKLLDLYKGRKLEL